MSHVEVRVETFTALQEYAQVPIAFSATSVFDVDRASDGVIRLVERRLPEPYEKDYDALEPIDAIAQHFDVSRWVLLVAWRADARVGGAIVAMDTHGVEMLEGRSDLGVLWDLRVEPAARRTGVGAALLDAAERHAVDRGCLEMKVETQNVNVPACRFYASRGYTLAAALHERYPTLPEEIQLLWRRRLA